MSFGMFVQSYSEFASKITFITFVLIIPSCCSHNTGFVFAKSLGLDLDFLVVVSAPGTAAHVANILLPPHKLGPTNIALEAGGPDPLVRHPVHSFLVSHQVGRLVERLLAHLALVGPLAGVGADVADEGRVVSGAVVAVAALEWSGVLPSLSIGNRHPGYNA